MLYIANNTFILEYNGKVWKSISFTDGGKTPTSFAKAKNGIIYTGGENEIGYLDKSAEGKTFYNSLNHLLTENEKDFNQVWNTLSIQDDIYYCANERIIRYRAGKIKSWKPSTAFHKAQAVNGILLVREVDKGLFFLKNDSLCKIEGSELFSGPEYKIAFFLPTENKNEFLIFTRKKGVFKIKLNMDGLKNSSITKEAGQQFKIFSSFEPYDAICLEDNNIVIGSIDKGLFVFDKNFNLLQALSTSSGLINNECRRLFIDAQKNLWVAFNNGLAKIEINSPLKKWDKYNGIEGSVEKVIKYKGKSYIATSKGLMVYDNVRRVFNSITEISERCIDLQVIKDVLYISSENGLYCYDEQKVKPVYQEGAVYKILFSAETPGVIYCSTDHAIVQINSSGQKLISEIASPLNSPILYMAFLTKNKIIASTRSEGIFTCGLLSNGTTVLPKNDFYKTTTDNFLFDHGGKVYIGTDKGLFEIDKELKFLSVDAVNALIKNKYCVTNAAFHEKELFMALSSTAGQNRGKEENICFDLSSPAMPQPIHLPLRKTGEMGTRQFYFDSVKTFIASDEGIFILDKSIPFNPLELKCYFSNIVYNNDTILYNYKTNLSSAPREFGKNEFIFEFGANDFSDESKLLFQFYLEGYESDYNQWTGNYRASYNNIKLREGDYTFHVRAKNIYGQISGDLLYKFQIQPPWYRTKAAWIIYFIISTGMVLLIVKLNAKRLVEQNKRLEKIIDDRTQTITHQKTEIEHKNKEITDSINYAQKIQLALMASLKLLDKNLSNKTGLTEPKDYFLLYHPKDIVSGDFYWATELQLNGKKHFLIVTADCTGHGVPGAFMSLLCIGFLNEITKEKQIVEPGKVFDELRARIISTLNPEGSDTERKDGMDAVLLSFSMGSAQMNYAAANNSIYVIRNNEIIILKADKMPVGKYSDDNFKPFSSGTFMLEENDAVYAFTDGYADQFGGPKGKKFKYKQLEELLLEIHQVEASKQKEILNQKFNDWKNSQEQVDDVLVLGIKF